MAMDDDGLNLAPLLPAVEALADALRDRGWRLATAESCTGGLIAAACTAIAGSSDWFERGVVTYSNASKTEWLGVPAELLAAPREDTPPPERSQFSAGTARIPRATDSRNSSSAAGCPAPPATAAAARSRSPSDIQAAG